MESAEGPRHAVFVALFRGGAIAAESTCVIDQLSIVLPSVPLWTQRIGESGVGLRRMPVQRTTQPDVEEIHEIRVRDGVVVRRVGADDIELADLDVDCGLTHCNGRGCRGRSLLRMTTDSRDPLDGLTESARCIRQRTGLREVPDHGEGKPRERASNLVVIICPGRQGAATVGEATERRRQAGDQRFAPLDWVAAIVNLIPDITDLLGEGAHRQKLTVAEKLVPSVKAVACGPNSESVLTRSGFFWNTRGDVRIECFECRPTNLSRQ